jgi:hypothetical protein
LAVGLEVPECDDASVAVVDGLAAAVVLTHYLPIFEPGDDVFDAGLDPPVVSVAVRCRWVLVS